jgi:hypothetical protein
VIAGVDTIAIAIPCKEWGIAVFTTQKHSPPLLLCLLCHAATPRFPSAHACRRDVDPALRRALLDEALETQEQDNEELLTKYRQRLDRCAWLAGCHAGPCAYEAAAASGQTAFTRFSYQLTVHCTCVMAPEARPPFATH